MKKILLVIVPIMLLTGCGAEPITRAEARNLTYYIQDSINFDFYVDKETCVEYILFSDVKKGNITPRLNDDGTLKLNEICLKDKGD